MRIIYNKLIPFGKRYHAINLCGIVFAKGPCDKETINHERIHTAQMVEMAVIFFYLWYVVEWCVRLIQHHNIYEAYRNISFEKEAYANMSNLNYLKARQPYAVFKFLSKK